MDEIDLLTFNDKISCLRFELNLCQIKNKDLSEQLVSAYKEIDALQEKVFSLFKPIGMYFDEATGEVVETADIAPFSYGFSIQLPKKVFLRTKFKSDMKDDILKHFNQYLDEKILPALKHTFEEMLLKIVGFNE